MKRTNKTHPPDNSREKGQIYQFLDDDQSQKTYSKEDVIDFALFYHGTQGTAKYLGEDLFKIWEEKEKR